jgi:acyl-[acyl-carrier-protein]-phospholipid O-acyltransferase/long-chain-fatty-acid--[acyl-carrier-protein] ligase
MLAAVRVIYKVRPFHEEHLPKTGGVLLLANHVSYVDALVIAAACRRPVRFVIWDVLYRVWWMNGFLRLVGTVPISPTRAKDAIRSVATALKEGEVVCLFPEGQITRHGMINELRKGFELMARQGDARVVPVYLDGLYGSIFSFQGGRFFTKMPHHLRYPVSVRFGAPLGAREASAEAVRHEMLKLGNQALLSRKTWEDAHDDLPAFANAFRLSEVEWHRPGDVFLSLEPEDSIVTRTVKALTQMIPGSKFVTRADQAHASHIVAFGTRNKLPQLSGQERLVFCLDSDIAPLPSESKGLRGYIDSATEVLVAVEVPDPVPAKGDEEPQHGRKPGSLGRLLPGFTIDHLPDGLQISGLLPKNDRQVLLKAFHLDEHGFISAS